MKALNAHVASYIFSLAVALAVAACLLKGA